MPGLAFQQQFERSSASPEVERVKHVVDGAAALKKFTEGGAPVYTHTRPAPAPAAAHHSSST